MSIILGIDPGSRTTGFGVIKVERQRFQFVDAGCINLKTGDLPYRLKTIFVSIQELIQAHRVTTAAIEQVFVDRNVSSALKLGQARGAAITAMGYLSLDVAEYSAREIKKAVVGYGAATKPQVQHMVKTLLGLRETPPTDAADALAVALCHAQSQQVLKSLKQHALEK